MEAATEAIGYKQLSLELSRSQATAAAFAMQSLSARRDDLDASMQVEGATLEAIADGFLARDPQTAAEFGADETGRGGPSGTLQAEINNQVSALGDLQEQYVAAAAAIAPGIGDEVRLSDGARWVLAEDAMARRQLK